MNEVSEKALIASRKDIELESRIFGQLWSHKLFPVIYFPRKKHI